MMDEIDEIDALRAFGSRWEDKDFGDGEGDDKTSDLAGSGGMKSGPWDGCIVIRRETGRIHRHDEEPGSGIWVANGCMASASDCTRGISEEEGGDAGGVVISVIDEANDEKLDKSLLSEIADVGEDIELDNEFVRHMVHGPSLLHSEG